MEEKKRKRIERMAEGKKKKKKRGEEREEGEEWEEAPALAFLAKESCCPFMDCRWEFEFQMVLMLGSWKTMDLNCGGGMVMMGWPARWRGGQ